MTRVQLFPHPATPAAQVNSLDVAIALADGGGLQVHFDCRCPAGALRLPPARRSEAADELWRHTCCELFAGAAGAAAYREFNWSPSGLWAAYSFSDYRVLDASAPNMNLAAPRIAFATDSAGWTLTARLDASALPIAAAGAIELGVAAVLEAADGSLSYWALQHAAPRPDFHRRESFVLRRGEAAGSTGNAS